MKSKTDILNKKSLCDMSEDQKTFVSKMQSLFYANIFALVFAIVIGGVTFYFNSKNAIAANSEKIKILEERKANKEAYEITVKNINDQLIEIKQEIKTLKN